MFAKRALSLNSNLMILLQLNYPNFVWSKSVRYWKFESNRPSELCPRIQYSQTIPFRTIQQFDFSEIRQMFLEHSCQDSGSFGILNSDTIRHQYFYCSQIKPLLYYPLSDFGINIKAYK